MVPPNRRVARSLGFQLMIVRIAGPGSSAHRHVYLVGLTREVGVRK